MLIWFYLYLLLVQKCLNRDLIWLKFTSGFPNTNTGIEKNNTSIL